MEIIDTGFNTGRFNMDFDLRLINRCKNENISILRFYGWRPYCISLGYNQGKGLKENVIDYEKCKRDGVDVVRRPTGGRAVFHAEEITYSVITKSGESVQALHNKISLALIKGLQTLDISNANLQKLSLVKETPNLLKLARTGMYNLCFNTSIKYEVNLNGRKLIGSAQRKIDDIILQHGSILIGDYHKNIVNYLSVNEESVRQKLKEQLDQNTTNLNELMNKVVFYNEVKEAVIKGFEQIFEVKYYCSAI
jgi:lipoate-protein ligase A